MTSDEKWLDAPKPDAQQPNQSVVGVLHAYAEAEVTHPEKEEE